MTGVEVCEAFARAIVRDGGNALLLRPDNSGDGWVAIPDAVLSGRAFAVDLRKEILAGDWDASDGVLRARQCADLLVRRGHAPIVVASGRPGHAHVLCVIHGERERCAMATHARQTGADVRRTIRPPLSPHRFGLPSTLVAPRNVEAALDALRVRPTAAS